MPTAGTDKPIQRVPSGFPGPGGIGEASRAQSESGGYHHGLRHLTTTRKRPSGVGYREEAVRVAPDDDHRPEVLARRLRLDLVDRELDRKPLVGDKRVDDVARRRGA